MSQFELTPPPFWDIVNRIYQDNAPSSLLINPTHVNTILPMTTWILRNYDLQDVLPETCRWSHFLLNMNI